MLKGKANREVCNVQIFDYATKKPLLDFEYANTTGLSITSDNVYAMAHGARKIPFNNPLEGQITITAQVIPTKVYALYSDGVIDTTASYYSKKTITCTKQGEIDLNVSGGTVIAGTVFVFPVGEYGEKEIPGTFAEGKFTATTPTEIAQGSSYDVGFMVSRETGVQKIVLNNKRIPKDVMIQMDTLDKDTDGNLVGFRINVPKAAIQRNLELNFSSEGDPREITMTFTILEKDRDNFVELVEIEEDITVNV